VLTLDQWMQVTRRYSAIPGATRDAMLCHCQVHH
jgi:hypothetical protein